MYNIDLNNNNYDIYVDGVFVNTYVDDLLHFINVIIYRINLFLRDSELRDLAEIPPAITNLPL